MKVIGLTGGVGSGKTTVLKIMEEQFSVKAVMADEAGHLAYQKGSSTFCQIVDHFGKAVLDAKGEVDRMKLGQLVMQDKKELLFLNSVIHPFVRRYIMGQLKEAGKSGCRYFVIESAILIECGYEDICDEFWYVSVGEENRRKRLFESRGYTSEKIEAILKNQKDDRYFREKCTKVIDNNCEKETIIKQLKLLLV